MTKPTRRGRKLDANSKSGQIRTMLSAGMATGEIAKKLGCTPSLVYNVKSRLTSGTPKRGPGRPPKAKASSNTSMGYLSRIVDAVQGAERERAKLRTALERIQGVLRDVLA